MFTFCTKRPNRSQIKEALKIQGLAIGLDDRTAMRAPSANALSLAKAVARGMYSMPQLGAGISRSGGRCASVARIRAATVCGVSDSESPMLITPNVREELAGSC
jgi:hypothetical protein